MIIKGADLTEEQRRQVANAFVNRSLSIGPGRYYATDEDWFRDHSFAFTKAGRLYRRRSAMPIWWGERP